MFMEAYKCERCGAPLEVTPETIVAVCPYCGFPNHITGNLRTEDMFIVPSMNKNQIAEAFWRTVERDFDLRRIKDSIQIVEIEGHYAPYWVGDVHVEGDVEYTVLEEECHTYTDSEGKTETRCHTVERHYHDHVDETLHLIGPARRQVASFGVDDIIKHYSRTNPEEKRLLDLDEGQWERLKLEILNTEMDEEQAKLMMREDAIDVIRNRYSAKADRIDLFDVKAGEPNYTRLVLLPMWTVYYKFENSIYHSVFSGWDGKRVASTEPMSTLRRAEYLGGVVLGLLIGAFGVAYGAGVNDLGIGAFSLGIGSVLSGYFGFKVLEGQRVERGG
ncbi:hypothetical protein [Thermococcus sp.]|uniref:hypothetical protein n=2 Tax=Thermococcus sp. TaxID=35749 RepID=UPI003457EE3E